MTIAEPKKVQQLRKVVEVTKRIKKISVVCINSQKFIQIYNSKMKMHISNVQSSTLMNRDGNRLETAQRIIRQPYKLQLKSPG